MKRHKAARKGFTLIELLVVISIIGVLAGLSLTAIGPIRAQFKKFRCRMMLTDLYKILMLYSADWNSYPTTQPSQTRYEKSGGVRDLYPLYSTGLVKRDALSKLLQPPGAALLPFSDDPTIDEFDRKHIGFSYNSTTIPDDTENPPLVAEQGVSGGKLNYNTKDKGLKPIRKSNVLVLFSDGTVELIPATKKGVLSTRKVAADQWGRLVD